MTGIIYLRTDRFEVKLEGITFKVKDFESLCTSNFLFPDGKIWSRQPVVGIDIMRHPRDHNVILLLLCIGIGCLILRFRAGESLPNPIIKFLTDERIRFVGFALPKLTYVELGLARRNVDIRYLAALHLNDSTYKRFELKELARKVLGIKRMIALTEEVSFERHEHIKSAICKLFITSAIGNALLGKKVKRKLDTSVKIMSILKSFNYLPLLSEGLLKLPRVKKDNNNNKSLGKIAKGKNDVPLYYMQLKGGNFVDDIDMNIETRVKEGNFVEDIDVNAKIQDIPLKKQLKNGYIVNDIDTCVGIKEDPLRDVFVQPKLIENVSGGYGLKEVNCAKYGRSLSINERANYLSDESSKNTFGNNKRPLKGILKCSSMSRLEYTSPLSIYKEPTTLNNQLRRANSKGFNVSFAFK